MIEPRLGHINFINCLPLTYGLTHGGYGKGLQVEAAVPSRLNELIMSGLLDASPVSSIVYARNSSQLLVLPDASISADGALESILLVAKKPIDALDGARIALTNKSATSHCLLKIIMHRAYQARPQYFISSLSLSAGVLDEADAVLFIGDDALYAYHNRIEGYYYYDLGAEWKQLTGLSMVYALWVVNRNFAAQRQEIVQTIFEKVTGGFRYGLEHIESAVDTLIGKVPFTAQQLSHYIGLLNYRFTSQHQEALLTYYRFAYELELVPTVPDIEFAEVTI